jgi:diacylglycerol kinase (ATP)
VYAWRGLVTLVKTQWNARVHLAATIVVCASGLSFRITAGEWCAIFLAIGLVWVAEALNTAVETLGDRITQEADESIGRAKDLAAGAVLFAALVAVVIGAIVFCPRLYVLLVA